MWLLLFPIHAAGGLFLAWLANWLGLNPWRRGEEAHWTERARRLWPVRMTAMTNVLLIPILLGEVQIVLLPGSSSWWFVSVLAGLFGAMLGNYPLDRAVYPRLHFRFWLHQAVATWGLRFGFLGALVLAACLMPAQFGWGMVTVVGGYLAFHAALQRGLFLQYLRWVNFLQPANPRLQEIVNAQSARLGIRPRATWLMGGVQALAYAFPTTRELAFSQRLLEICTEEEVSVICAHELAHLTESKAVLTARMLGSLSLFPFIFMRPAIHWFGPLGFVVPLVALLILVPFTRRLSMRMEKRADKVGTDSQLNEGVYAGALEKIYRENQVPAVNASNRQTHPHLYDRMIAAGLTPDYPRPRKAKAMTWIGFLYAVGVGLLFAVVMGRQFH